MAVLVVLVFMVLSEKVEVMLALEVFSESVEWIVLFCLVRINKPELPSLFKPYKQS
jgi:hypothetical protein